MVHFFTLSFPPPILATQANFSFSQIMELLRMAYEMKNDDNAEIGKKKFHRALKDVFLRRRDLKYS
jgi:hypothetical protein